MNLDKLKEKALPGDIILLGSDSFLGYLIRYYQRPISGQPSLWSHVVVYIDSMTIFESTIDFDHYKPTDSIWDNGAQFNELDSLKDYGRGVLCQYPLGMSVRQEILNICGEMEGKYLYPISGLIGSMLSFWALDKIGLGENNLLNGPGLYCSAAVQMAYAGLYDFAQGYSTRNTAPEHIWRHARKEATTWSL